MDVNDLLEVCMPHCQYDFYDIKDDAFPLNPYASYYDRDAAIGMEGHREVISWNVEENGEPPMYDQGTNRDWTAGPIAVWVEL